MQAWRAAALGPGAGNRTPRGRSGGGDVLCAGEERVPRDQNAAPEVRRASRLCRNRVICDAPGSTGKAHYPEAPMRDR